MLARLVPSLFPVSVFRLLCLLMFLCLTLIVSLSVLLFILFLLLFSHPFVSPPPFFLYLSLFYANDFSLYRPRPVSSLHLPFCVCPSTPPPSLPLPFLFSLYLLWCSTCVSPPLLDLLSLIPGLLPSVHFPTSVPCYFPFHSPPMSVPPVSSPVPLQNVCLPLYII